MTRPILTAKEQPALGPRMAGSTEARGRPLVGSTGNRKARGLRLVGSTEARGLRLVGSTEALGPGALRPSLQLRRPSLQPPRRGEG